MDAREPYFGLPSSWRPCDETACKPPVYVAGAGRSPYFVAFLAKAGHETLFVLRHSATMPAGWRSRRLGRAPGRGFCRTSNRRRQVPELSRAGPGRRALLYEAAVQVQKQDRLDHRQSDSRRMAEEDLGNDSADEGAAPIPAGSSPRSASGAGVRSSVCSTRSRPPQPDWARRAFLPRRRRHSAARAYEQVRE